MEEYSLLYKLALRLFNLKIEDARLVLAVKLTKLFGAIVVLFVSFILLLAMLGFASLSIAQLLSDVMPAAGAYAIIAAFYLLLVVLVILVRKPLILDPIARFISRLIVEPPKQS